MSKLIKTPAEIELMTESGRMLARALKEIRKEVRPGVEAAVLDLKTREIIKKIGGEPAFLDYSPHDSAEPFPAALCVSINEVAVHGVPGQQVLKPGDVVKIDMGVIYKGYYSDAAFTVALDPAPKGAKELIRVTEEALRAGIKAAKPGSTLGDIGYAISERVNKAGFSIIQGLTGHGIGRDLHEDPFVYNTGKRGDGDVLKPGMVIAIEPMVAIGKGAMRQLADGSFVTKDKSLTAHFEHTVAILKDGPRVLT